MKRSDITISAIFMIIFTAITFAGHADARPDAHLHAWFSHESASIQSFETPDSIHPSYHDASLDEMIGQMIMVGITGNNISENTLLADRIWEGKIGGIILFEKNLSPDSTALRVRELTRDFQQCARIPLLIAIDQEGGRVNRLKVQYGFPESKTASWLGGQNNFDTTLYYAGQIASTLASLGININFAPVVDLCSNPNNPVIAGYERCYHADPHTVAKHAGWFIDAHHSHGILTTLKHFPGHGSSTKDTHKELTDVTGLWTADELIPYENLIQRQKVDAVMSAHIVHCNLDTACLPATMSQAIITGLLRDSMGFEGVVFSDDMQMKAISTYYGLDTSVKMAILAGIDILIFSNNIRGVEELHADTVHRIIAGMVANGEISEARIRASYQRIMHMKKGLTIH